MTGAELRSALESLDDNDLAMVADAFGLRKSAEALKEAGAGDALRKLLMFFRAAEPTTSAALHAGNLGGGVLAHLKGLWSAGGEGKRRAINEVSRFATSASGKYRNSPVVIDDVKKQLAPYINAVRTPGYRMAGVEGLARNANRFLGQVSDTASGRANKVFSALTRTNPAANAVTAGLLNVGKQTNPFVQARDAASGLYNNIRFNLDAAYRGVHPGRMYQ